LPCELLIHLFSSKLVSAKLRGEPMPEPTLPATFPLLFERLCFLRRLPPVFMSIFWSNDSLRLIAFDADCIFVSFVSIPDVICLSDTLLLAAVVVVVVAVDLRSGLFSFESLALRRNSSLDFSELVKQF
jgi:hypothetical protein